MSYANIMKLVIIEVITLSSSHITHGSGRSSDVDALLKIKGYLFVTYVKWSMELDTHLSWKMHLIKNSVQGERW